MEKFPLYLILAVCIMTPRIADAHPIDLQKIQQIESSGNPRAVGTSGERGLYQITPGVWKDYLRARGLDKGDPEHLFDPHVNKKVADWYFKWLFFRCQTVKDTIISYNWGIGNWRKWKARGAKFSELPLTTQKYLKKYGGL